MRRFRVLFVVFSLALAAPLALLVHRAIGSLALERQMRHQAVAERIFDEMERALTGLLDGEERQSLDRYGIDLPPEQPACIVGRFAVDSDGGVRALPTGRGGEKADETVRTVGDYWRQTRTAPPEARAPAAAAAQLPGTTLELDKRNEQAVRGAAPEEREKEAPKDEVSAFAALRSLNKGVLDRADRQRKLAEPKSRNGADLYAEEQPPSARRPMMEAMNDSVGGGGGGFELPPMTGRVIDASHLMLFRTLAWGGQAHRQGVLVDLNGLGDWLREQGLGDGLRSQATISFANPFAPPAGSADPSAFVYRHRFAEPFDGLTARLDLLPLPGVGSATYVYALSALLLASAVFGLGALYRMVSVVVGYAERQSNFVAAVSHELKTPLTAIRMYGEMLRDGIVPSEAKREEYYRHITLESERLSRLINNVLEFSRLEKGSREVPLVVGSPEPVLREVAELLRPHAKERGFDLDVAIEGDLPAVRFERDALVQVLCNLVDNAVKYACDAPAKRIELGCRRSADGVSVGVRDHGPGVPVRHLGKIFEPFYRGESELTRRSKGVGLGLALVQSLAERMGARVNGRNAPGGGFEVEIFLRGAELQIPGSKFQT